MAGRVLLAKIEDAGGQVRSVARRFALVAVAGELATKAGITGWPQGEAMRAAQVMFSAWLKERGTTGASEDERAKRQLAAFLSRHGASRIYAPRSTAWQAGCCWPRSRTPAARCAAWRGASRWWR